MGTDMMNYLYKAGFLNLITEHRLTRLPMNKWFLTKIRNRTILIKNPVPYFNFRRYYDEEYASAYEEVCYFIE